MYLPSPMIQQAPAAAITDSPLQPTKDVSASGLENQWPPMLIWPEPFKKTAVNGYSGITFSQPGRTPAFK